MDIKRILLILNVCVMLTLLGCTQINISTNQPILHCQKSCSTIQQKLENRGVKVVILGDQILMVISSRDVFEPMTAHVRSSAYYTLDLVSCFISQYPNMSVQVAGYTNDVGSKCMNDSLSQAQAENVQRYLWRRDINTRMITAKGYGGSKLVEPNSHGWDEGENFRIEITLEKLPV